MSLCYDGEKWLMVTLASVAISLTVGLLMQYAHGQEFNFRRILELEKYCTIAEFGVGDDQQNKSTITLKNEYVCKELSNYKLSNNPNASIVSKDNNQIVIDVPKNQTALEESIKINQRSQKFNKKLLECLNYTINELCNNTKGID